MRKILKTPRILKISKINGYKIHCAFNNGEHRIIDFDQFFKEWNLRKRKTDFRYQLLDMDVFKKVKLANNSLSWMSIKKNIKLSNGMEYEVAFEIDPIVLFERSVSDDARNEKSSIGKVLKIARKKAGLTQDELAKRSGTTRYYISRIENDRSDIELGTLRKIIELGLNKSLKINIS